MSCRASLRWPCTLLSRISSQKKLLNFSILRFSNYLNYEKSLNSNKIEYYTKKSADLLLRSVQERRSILHRYSPSRKSEHVIACLRCLEKSIFSNRSVNVPKSFPERFGSKPGTFWNVLLESSIHALSICREGIVWITIMSMGSPLEFLIQSHIQAGRVGRCKNPWNPEKITFFCVSFHVGFSAWRGSLVWDNVPGTLEYHVDRYTVDSSDTARW